jgi:hypothetical protein
VCGDLSVQGYYAVASGKVLPAFHIQGQVVQEGSLFYVKGLHVGGYAEY